MMPRNGPYVGGASDTAVIPHADAHGPSREAASIAFLPVRDLHLPHNNREVFLSRELAGRGWNVFWLRPHSGTNRCVAEEWPILRYPDLDVRGRKYLLPTYLAVRLRLAGVRTLWLSGWTMRDLPGLYWLTTIVRKAGIRIVYDPIDPICEIQEAQGLLDRDQSAHCMSRAREIYARCDLTICVTPEIRELLIANGAPADRLMVARWGTDGKRFDPAASARDLKTRLGLAPESFLVGWLGTMEPFKGLMEVILPLIERVAREPRVHFVIAGRGALEPEIRRWAAERPHLPVTVLSSIDYADAPNFTGSLDAYLVPTNPETAFAQSICPVKCFDALAMGTPLIVSRTRATEFLGRYDQLVSLADFDPDSFASCLLRLVRSSPSPGRVGQPVREYTHQNVSVTIADAITSIDSRSIQPRQSPRMGGQ